jgi:Histidine kinase-like ATPase domain
MDTPGPRTIGLRTTEVTYPGGTEYTRAVRADLRASLDDCSRADDVILCASELAANAAQHSRSRLPGGTFTVRAVISPDHYARIEVQDNGGPWNQGMIDPTRHHGLDIVRLSPTNGGSTATTPPALSGRDSTAPSSRSKACAGAIRRPPYRCCEDFLHDHQGRTFGAPRLRPEPATRAGASNRGRAERPGDQR